MDHQDNSHCFESLLDQERVENDCRPPCRSKASVSHQHYSMTEYMSS